MVARWRGVWVITLEPLGGGYARQNIAKSVINTASLTRLIMGAILCGGRRGEKRNAEDDGPNIIAR